MTQASFDEKRWAEIIQQPQWYLDLSTFFNDAAKNLGEDSDQFVALRRQVRLFFEQQFKAGKVKLADDGPNLDSERLTIDTIVIHHTSGKPGYRLSYMEATQLLNIYARHYSDENSHKKRGLKNEAIWSGHFRNGKQTFICYHWLMRMDGSFERLLNDDQIGWQAGDWDINKRSLAICLDNDYEHQDPSPDVLHKLAAFIKKNYPNKKIIGHCEVRQGTICPGGNFLHGWKPLLLEYL